MYSSLFKDLWQAVTAYLTFLITLVAVGAAIVLIFVK